MKKKTSAVAPIRVRRVTTVSTLRKNLLASVARLLRSQGKKVQRLVFCHGTAIATQVSTHSPMTGLKRKIIEIFMSFSRMVRDCKTGCMKLIHHRFRIEMPITLAPEHALV